MATNLGELFATISADTRGLSKAERDMLRFEKKGNKSLASVGKAARLLRFAFIALSTTMITRVLASTIKVADGYNVLQQRIKTATKATGDYVKVSKELFRISKETGSSLKTNVGLFQSLARTSTELKATNTEMLKLASTVSKIGVISGSTADEVKFGVRQFTQGLAAGVFRAEEFNSILENVPELASRIARGLERSDGGLRQAIISGRILSKDVFDSLLKQTDSVDEEFANMRVSIDRAKQSLDNSFVKFLGDFSEASGLGDVLAKSLVSLSDTIDGLDAKGTVDKTTTAFLKLKLQIDAVTGTLDNVFGQKGGGGDFEKSTAEGTRQIINFIKRVEDAFDGFSESGSVKAFRDSIKSAAEPFAVGDGFLLSETALAQEKMAALEHVNVIMNEREIALQRKKEADDREVELERQKQAKLKETLQAAIKERQKLEALDAFFGINNIRNKGKDQTTQSAMIFRGQISQAAQFSKEFFELNKALALATAAIEAPKAILSSYAFGAQFGGPVLGAAFAGIAAAATGAQIAGISSAQFGGGRQTGGDVTPNRSFRVAENGPELFKSGNESFLLTGSSGGSVAPVTGGGGKMGAKVNLTIINNGQQLNATAESTENGDATDITVVLESADEFLANRVRSGDSELSKSLETTFGLNRSRGAI